MEFSICRSGAVGQKSGCLILGVYEKRKLTPTGAQLDEQMDGWLSGLIRREKMEGKLEQTLLLCAVPDSPLERILLVGLGKEQPLTDKQYRKALAAAIRKLKETQARDAVCTLAEVAVKERDLRWQARQTALTFENALYRFDRLKKSEDKPPPLAKIRLLVQDSGTDPEARQGLAEGQAIANGMSLAKDLANLPGNVCTPSYLADEAKKLAKHHESLQAKILSEKDMEKLGMGALLSVSKGSREEAKLIILEYKGGPAKSKPVALVGKGLTFDAGGISLKPAQAMDEMKYDMCGGASVLGTLAAVAELQLPVNVVGIIPSSENLPDGAANKPGDIVTSMAGTTIEILNTDAEGRLILCDALTYSERFKPRAVIDIATLTGACIIALGNHPSGLLGNDEALCQRLIQCGQTAGDPAWQLPLWEEYQEQLKSNFADVANVGGREAGTITAACFLARFTEKLKWAHLDIAGTAWRSGKEKGATGRPVPLLVQYLLDEAG